MFSVVTAAESHVPYLLLSEIAFLGIMFNAASIANMSAARLMPNVFVCVMGITFFLSTLFAVIYSNHVGLTTATWQAWTLTIVLLVFAVGLSFITTNSDNLEDVENAIETADLLENLPNKVRTDVLKAVVEMIRTGDREILQAFTSALKDGGIDFLCSQYYEKKQCDLDSSKGALALDSVDSSAKPRGDERQ